MKVNLNAPILVVDDVGTMIKILKTLLNQIGFTKVDDAGSAEEAIKKIEKSNQDPSKAYQLIISDWYMDKLSGLDLLSWIRSDPLIKHTPFIIVTSDSKVDNLAAADRAGVDQYLIKPFTAEVLRKKIEALFDSR